MEKKHTAIKLYTEEQVMQCYNMGVNDGSYGRLRENIEDLDLTPIELPSDEEIEKYINSFPYTKHLDDGQYNDGVMVGAELGIEWYREQLKK